jgi:PAS domain S-box-containing protein
MSTSPLNITDSRKFCSSVLEGIAEGIVVIGLDKKIIFINKMARELTGIKTGKVEGRPCQDVINTDLCSSGCPLDSNKGASCAAHFMNIKLYGKDEADSIPLCLNVAPLLDDLGNTIGIIENFRPMSEAIKIIESLEQNNVLLSQEKNKIASIINSLADGVFTLDKELRITSFNNGMESLTGKMESDVIGLKCKDVFSADNCDSNCPLAYTLKNGYGIANVSERIAGKDGDLIPVFMSTAFLKEGDADIGLIATIRDASEIERLKKEINDRYHFSNIIGKSDRMQQIFDVIESLKDTDCAVLIEGESGTGKELIARAIHHESYRRNKPFVKVDCSAIVEGLFESELFGHVRGAFTGAIRDKAGKFEIADGGTVFLDEIGDMPHTLQPKLLRAIQDKEFERVGDTKTKRVDVAIIAATNKNLKEEISNNRFRGDLYYRLCVVPIEMPPLRERKEDIHLLISHFLEKCSLKIPNKPMIGEVTSSAMSVLMDYNWPGNIRELENAIEHAYIRSKTEVIDVESLPISLTASQAQEASFLNIHNKQIDKNEAEKLYLEKLLDQYNGNRTRVAKRLGLSRTTLWRKLKKFDLAR